MALLQNANHVSKSKIKGPLPVRSKNSSTAVKLVFKNLTGQEAALYWVDFNGHPQLFGHLSPSRRRESGFLVETFVSHPWVCTVRDRAVTLGLNGKRYFFPPDPNKWRSRADGGRSLQWRLKDTIGTLGNDEGSGSSYEDRYEVLISCLGVVSLKQRCLLRCCSLYQRDEEIDQLPLPRLLKKDMKDALSKYFV